MPQLPGWYGVWLAPQSCPTLTGESHSFFICHPKACRLILGVLLVVPHASPAQICSRHALVPLTNTRPRTRPYRSFFSHSTVTFFSYTWSDRFFLETDANGCAFSGASMPANRTFTLSCSPTKTVIVSPSDWSCPNSPDTLTLSNRVICFNDIGV